MKKLLRVRTTRELPALRAVILMGAVMLAALCRDAATPVVGQTTNAPGVAALPGATNTTNAPSVSGSGGPFNNYVYPLLDTNGVIIWPTNFFTANSGQILAQMPTNSNGGVLTNILKSYVIPQQFGALGDGTTDDWPAMMAWLNYAAISNLTAKLPPAPGGFYKITDALIVTNKTQAYSLHIEGEGGAHHITDAVKHTCCIKQFTSGKDGIQITNDASGIWIEGIRLLANTYNFASRGIAFDGTTGNADVCKINMVGIEGFGKGVALSGVAVTLIDGCSIGHNGIGLYSGLGVNIAVPLVNQIRVQSSVISYNRTNNVLCAYGTVSISDCDITQGDDGSGVYTNCYEVFIGEHGYLTLFRCSLENQIAASYSNPSVSSTNGGFLAMYQCVSQNQGGARAWTLALTNCYARLSANVLSGAATDGYTILENTGINGGLSKIVSDGYTAVKYIVNSSTYLGNALPIEVGNFLDDTSQAGIGLGRQVFVMHSPHWWDQFGVNQGGNDDLSSLVVGVKLNGFMGSGATNIDLTAYKKDTMTILPARNISASGTVFISTNALANWPTAPLLRGDQALVNSNGASFILKSGPNGATWISTNLWF